MIEWIKDNFIRTYLDAKYPLTLKEELFIEKVWQSCKTVEQQTTVIDWVDYLTGKRRLKLGTALIYSLRSAKIEL